jgi:FkbM family methyltransferase
MSSSSTSQELDVKAAAPVAREARFLRRVVLATPLGKPARYAARHIRRWLSQIPIPARLPYGAWWLIRNDNIGEAVSDGFETLETSFVERFVKPGMTVLDVGANQGYYTLLASRMVGNCGRVISFEPSPREVRALQLHLKLNRCKNVTVAGVAAGAEKRQANLFVVQGYETACNSLRPPVVFSETAAVRVEVVRLDDWLEAHKIERVDFIKLDVEGGELEALKGAEKMLERRPRPVILMEVQDLRTQPWGYRAKKVIEHLQGKGFRWMQPGKDGSLKDLDLHLDEFDGNFVAWPEELASGLEALKTPERATPNGTRKI